MNKSKFDPQSEELRRGKIVQRRRQLIKALGYGTVSTTLCALPIHWSKPLVNRVIVPAHAEMSNPLPSTTPQVTTTVCAITYMIQTQKIPLDGTDWENRILTFDQWNPADGPLGRVVITRIAQIEGTAKVENESEEPETITLTLAAEETVTGPNGPLSAQLPTWEDTSSYKKFDGTTDYAGDSGETFADQSANDQDVTTITDPAELAAYAGTGTINFTVSAQSTSKATGSGNISSGFSVDAGVEITIEYFCF